MVVWYKTYAFAEHDNTPVFEFVRSMRKIGLKNAYAYIKKQKKTILSLDNVQRREEKRKRTKNTQQIQLSQSAIIKMSDYVEDDTYPNQVEYGSKIRIVKKNSVHLDNNQLYA